MNFEFDLNKSRLNKIKHGVDFNQAQLIWDGPCIEFSAKSEFENRFALIGPIDHILYTCIFTLRSGNIRIISCRRSRPKEKKLYEKNISKTNQRKRI
ncbi:MAG: BrnT family toxin [Deltaproteobacteria bacterium]|nr:BrnT family toxin [Deltaproteobacteria bacterium]